MRSDRVEGSEAQRFLRARNERDIAYLIAALRHPGLRYVAVSSLGKLGAADAIPKIRPLLRASEAELRVAAARALGRLHDQESVGTLVDLAEHDADALVREWAVFSAGAIGVDQLHETRVLRIAGLPHRIRQSAIAALVLSPDERIAEAGRDLLRREPWLSRRDTRRAVTRMRRIRLHPPLRLSATTEDG
jgi:HEAT repeat protein